MNSEMSYLLALTLGGVRGGICELFLFVVAAGEGVTKQHSDGKRRQMATKRIEEPAN